ncbi:ISAs1 family transposase [Onishia niordana]|uniref:ISAs1 family transposase n=1 Tax=Onishia niordana TaxID=2508711 RepID=UPI0014485C9C|nr:ISAs1 family transposase [Halomonas niordiana]
MAIDGKTLRGSYCRGKGKGAIYIVGAFSAANGVVLGHVKTAEKSNEVTAILELLKLLNLQGCLVTIDAMSCQKKNVTQVLQKGSDHLLSVKENQTALSDAFEVAFLIAEVVNFVGDRPMSQMRRIGAGKRHGITSLVGLLETFRSLDTSGLD